MLITFPCSRSMSIQYAHHVRNRMEPCWSGKYILFNRPLRFLMSLRNEKCVAANRAESLTALKRHRPCNHLDKSWNFLPRIPTCSLRPWIVARKVRSHSGLPLSFVPIETGKFHPFYLRHFLGHCFVQIFITSTPLWNRITFSKKFAFRQ